jgi:hypothetical protein
MVSRGGGERTFYRVRGQAGRSGGGRSSGGWWCFIKASVTEEEVRGRLFDEGCGTSVRFGSILVREGGTRRRMAHRHGPKGRRRLRHPKVGEDLAGWAVLGRSGPQVGPTQKKTQGK